MPKEEERKDKQDWESRDSQCQQVRGAHSVQVFCSGVLGAVAGSSLRRIQGVPSG